MLRLLSLLARAAFAVTLGLLLLAVLRWPPVAAEPALDVRALPLALPLVVFAVLAALTGRERRAQRLRPLAVALVSVLGALALVVGLRGPAGLAADVGNGAASEKSGALSPG